MVDYPLMAPETFDYFKRKCAMVGKSKSCRISAILCSSRCEAGLEESGPSNPHIIRLRPTRQCSALPAILPPGSILSPLQVLLVA